MEQAEGFFIRLHIYIINETPMATTKGKTFCKWRPLVIYKKTTPNIPPRSVPINLFIPVWREFSTVSWTQITAAIAAKREFGQNIRQTKTDKAVLMFLDPIWGNSKVFTVSTPIFLIQLYHIKYEKIITKTLVKNIKTIKYHCRNINS